MSGVGAIRLRARAGGRLAGALALLVLAGGCGAASASRPAHSRPAAHPAAREHPAARVHRTARPRGATTATVAAPAAATGRHHRHPRAAPDPGRLPQTAARPSATTPTFDAEMRALWAGVRTGRLSPAMPAFFPEAAYLQVKAIADAAGDWRSRLVGGYALDIGAAHALLGAGAAGARLLQVRVPSAYAHWVTPGTCYNRVGYWEVPNARVVYREDGTVRSFGIASMISWRGVWYVVHLGAVLRSGAGGEVDDPSTGPGVAAYSDTC